MVRNRRQHADKIQSCPAPQLELTSHVMDWWAQGIEHHQAGDLTQAEICYRRITPEMPAYIYARNNLGLLFNTLKRHKDAEKCCRQALELKPDYLAPTINLSNSLVALGKLKEAEQWSRHAVTLQPDSIEALGTLGNVLFAKGRMQEAEACFRRALSIKPDCLEIIISLGNVLTQTTRPDEAALTFQAALQLQPDCVDALNNLGHVLTALNRLHEARQVLLTALSLQPDNVHALLNLSLVFSALGQLSEAETRYRQALQYKPDYIEAMSNLLFMHNYRGENPTVALNDAKQYGLLVESMAKPFTHAIHTSQPPERLRIGLLSGDLLNHPVGYFLDGIFPFLNTGEVELFVYSTFFLEDELTARLKEAIPHWRIVVGMTDKQLAQVIHQDGIHILMDLSGHTARNRLPVFAWKPAPIQVTWLGYFATTGLASMDYILGDPINLPGEESSHFIETPWRLPDCYLCFTPPDVPIEVNPLPALATGSITFGCCNSIKKMTPTVVQCWASVLQAVPNSQLFLKNSALADPILCQSILEQFAHHQIAPQRLILEGPSTRNNYFNAYHRIDIALDPFPYPGVTTSVEGLWMGVPLITLRGHSFLSHQGESILTNAGLSDWIAQDQNDYVTKAIHFAHDLSALASLRTRLRQQVLNSPLFDTQRFANNLIQTWKQMWQIWCQKNQTAMDASNTIHPINLISSHTSDHQ